jgi:hypothetical protein
MMLSDSECYGTDQAASVIGYRASFPANSITLAVIPAAGSGPDPDPDPDPNPEPNPGLASDLFLPLTER